MKILGSGFTLVEVLVVIAIVALLTAIAVPQYTQYRLKEIRSDAVRSMMKLSLELERCRSRNGDGSFSNCPNTQVVLKSQQRHYDISIALNDNARSYVMTASKLGELDADCNTLTMTHDGLRDANSSNSRLDSAKKRIQRCWAN